MKLVHILEAEENLRQRGLRMQQRVIDEIDADAEVKLVKGVDINSHWRNVPLALLIKFSYGGAAKGYAIPDDPAAPRALDTIKNAYKKLNPTTKRGQSEVFTARMKEKYGTLYVKQSSVGSFASYGGWVYANAQDKQKDAGGGTMTRQHGVHIEMRKNHEGKFIYMVDRLPYETIEDAIEDIDATLKLKP